MSPCTSHQLVRPFVHVPAEGTFGVVFRAREKRTGKVYALKKLKLEREKDGFPQTSIREVNVLLSLHHPSIVNVTEVRLQRLGGV